LQLPGVLRTREFFDFCKCATPILWKPGVATPEFPKYRGVATPQFPKYRGVATPQLPKYWGVVTPRFPKHRGGWFLKSNNLVKNR